jgi:hypothetical protein
MGSDNSFQSRMEEKEKVQAYQEELKSIKKVGSQQILKNAIYYYCLDKADSFKLQSRDQNVYQSVFKQSQEWEWKEISCNTVLRNSANRIFQT